MPVLLSGDMETIVTGISTVVSVVGTVFTAILSNDYLVFCLAASALSIGIGKFRHLKKAA